MRLTRLSIPAIAVAVIVLLGAATAGVLAARATVTSDLTVEDSPTPGSLAKFAGAASVSAAEPSPASIAEPSPVPATELSPAPTAEPTPAPTEPPIEIPNRRSVAKSEAAIVEPTVATKDSESDDTGQGTVYTWRDGRATRRVVLQNDLVLQQAADRRPGDVVIASVGDDSIVRRQARHGAEAGPVFRSESGGELMALPGGVLLVLTPAWGQTEVTSFFAHNNIAADRTSALGTLPNGFRIETEPGFASLNLANALAGQDGVVLANPNWWREVEAK